MTVQEPAAGARERQRAAIEASGWGRPFRLLQPHALSFWVWAAGIAFGLWSLAHLLSEQGGVYTQAYVTSLVLFAVYAVLWWAFFRAIDRYERLSPKLALAGFVWGATVAPWAFSYNANTALGSLYGKLFGQPFAADWNAALSAPFVEEISKGAGFVLLLSLAPAIIRSPRAALFCGAFVGLGFEVFEDVFYGGISSAASFNGDEVGAALQSGLLRIAAGLFSHASYTALFSVGVLLIVGTPVVRPRRLAGVGFILLAMALHFVWDGAAAIGEGGMVSGLLPFVVAAAASAGLYAAFHISASYEQAWMRDVLAPELETGAVTEAEVAAAAGRRRDRRRFARDGAHHRKRRHLLDAVFDLAHEVSVAGGETTPAVEHARGEVVRLRARAAA